MLLPLGRIILATFPSRALNILISQGGDGNLLREVDDYFSSTTIHKDFTFASFALIFSHFFLSGLTRYLLGHAAATLLILEISRKDAVTSNQEVGSSKRPLDFRCASKAIRLIYGTQSFYTLSRGIVLAACYQVVHYVVRACLEGAFFRCELLKPFAYAGSSVLLCELHLLWTCATISAYRLGLPSFRKYATRRQWRHLATANLIYGICQALMHQVQSLVQRSVFSSGDKMQISTSKRASAEILAVIIVLAIRVVGLLPAFINLILTEASLLPGKFETIIPSPTKQRGSTIAELLGGGQVPLGLAAFRSALHAFGVPQFLWLLELHLKKCLIQITIELLDRKSVV